MKILILDRDTTTVDESVTFDKFKELGQVKIFANLTDPAQIVHEAADAQILVVNKVVLDRSLIEKLPSSVKLIVETATGYDNIDVDAATARGIKVANVPGYGTNAVSQLALFLILACAWQIIPQLDHLRNKGWDKKIGFSLPIHEIAGKTLGIVGLGEIGQAIAKLAVAFGMKVIAYNRSQKNIPQVAQVTLAELAAKADFISLNCALNIETNKMIDSQFLAQMKASAFLINTARGGVVDEVALAKALINKQIAGAALDVLTEEPPAKDNPLLNLDNVILTPHIGWVPIEARQRCIDIAFENIQQFLQGIPCNLLN